MSVEPTGPVDGARFEQLVARVAELARRLEAIERRLGGLSGEQAQIELEPAVSESFAVATEPRPERESATVRWVSLIGRTLLVMAGAFLIRALRDTGAVPSWIPAVAGLVYAAFWLAVAAKQRSRADSAVLHVTAAMLVAYPLVGEATLRFTIFPAPLAVAIVTGFALACVALTGWLQLAAIGWIGILGGIGTLFVLASGTRHLLAVTVALLVIGAVLEPLAGSRVWKHLRWPVALTLDAMLLMIVLILGISHGWPETNPPLPVAVVGGLLVVTALVYAGGLAYRTLIAGRPAGLFGLAQPVLAVGIALVGALILARENSSVLTAVGLLVLVLGTGCYAAAFSLADRRRGHERNFYFYSTLGGVLLLGGTPIAFGAAQLAVVSSVLALVTVTLGRRLDRFTLRYHGAVYAVVATVSAGLIRTGLRLFACGPLEKVSNLGAPGLMAAAASVGCLLLLLTRRRGDGVSAWRLAPELLVALAASWNALAVSVWAGAHALSATGLTGGAAVATWGTALVSILTVVYAWTGARSAISELRWLAWVLLGGGLVKLVLADMRFGVPVATCVSLAFLGGALIIISRIARRSANPL
ncbi:MAG: hypothetical protein JSV80_03385 [Acidobacteriota bacterium]|nr:MAG: hypothetical protein JSV80_03385 [Acidobacteriota bacterium]